MSFSNLVLSRAQTARIRNLFREKQVRQSEGAFVIEGARPVHELLSAHPGLMEMLVVSRRYLDREQGAMRGLRESLGVKCYTCSEHTFLSLSGLETPEGIMALVRQPKWNQDEVFERKNLIGVYGEQLQDPANVGAIIRTAAGLNATAFWLSQDSVDIYNPKVVRATSGALLSLPIFFTRTPAIFAQENCALYTAEPGNHGTVPMDTIKAVPCRMIIALGNESRGLSDRTVRQATCRFTIPMGRKVESLNVAATAAIALYHFGRLPKSP